MREDLTSIGFEEMFTAAGYPPGVFTTLLIGSEPTQAVIAHPVVTAVTLTGSEAAGVSVAGTAGAVLKKVVLELGGSDPFLVLEDADVDLVDMVRDGTGTEAELLEGNAHAIAEDVGAGREARAADDAHLGPTASPLADDLGSPVGRDARVHGHRIGRRGVAAHLAGAGAANVDSKPLSARGGSS